MIIRKLFKVESSHIVRDCSSTRCKLSLHGHSAVVEIFLTAKGLDNGAMLVDFGLLKGTIKDFVDSFDHCHIFWSKEFEKDKEFFREYSARHIELPMSPSAEVFSVMMFYVIDQIIKNTQFRNGEQAPELLSVRYHETTTGYAEAFREDLSLWKYRLDDIKFSPAIAEEWSNPLMWHYLQIGHKFINPDVDLRYQD